MKPFSIKFDTEEEYQEIRNKALKFGYKEKMSYCSSNCVSFTKNGEFRLYMFNPYNLILRWSTQHKEAIKFMKKNIGYKKPSSDAYTLNLEERINHLEKRLDDFYYKTWQEIEQKADKYVRNKIKSIDHKFRLRIHKLEQRELLSKMMHDDEKDGIYEDPFMRAKGMDNLGRVKQTGEELTNFLNEHPNESLSPVKIAIRVENEQEFNELINIMNARGWKKKSVGNATLDYNNMTDTNLVQFHDEYLFLHGIEWEKGFIGDYQIMSFFTLKEILGA